MLPDVYREFLAMSQALHSGRAKSFAADARSHPEFSPVPVPPILGSSKRQVRGVVATKVATAILKRIACPAMMLQDLEQSLSRGACPQEEAMVGSAPRSAFVQKLLVSNSTAILRNSWRKIRSLISDLPAISRHGEKI